MSAENAGRAVPGPTPSQTVGPFFGFALPFAGGGHPAPAHRTAVTLHGTVLDGAGEPVPDALLEFWQADAAGSLRGAPGSWHRDGYRFTGFARVATDAVGHWVVRTLAPGVPCPAAASVPGQRAPERDASADDGRDASADDGRDAVRDSGRDIGRDVGPDVGSDASRGPARGRVRSAPYLAVVVFARGLMHHLHTRVYLPSDQAALSRDPLLASLAPTRRRTLIARAEPDGALRFDIRLQGVAGAAVEGEEETVFLEFG